MCVLSVGLIVTALLELVVVKTPTAGVIALLPSK